MPRRFEDDDRDDPRPSPRSGGSSGVPLVILLAGGALFALLACGGAVVMLTWTRADARAERDAVAARNAAIEAERQADLENDERVRGGPPPGAADRPNKLPLTVPRSALGTGPFGKEVAALRKVFADDPEVVTRYDDCFFHSWKGRGLSLRFEEDRVTAVFFYADGADGYQQYDGELPEGLRFSDTRQDVERRLGNPTRSGGNGVIPFWVEYPKKGVGVTYVSKDPADRTAKIHHLTFTAAEDK